jgi:hypothetical protein
MGKAITITRTELTADELRTVGRCVVFWLLLLFWMGIAAPRRPSGPAWNVRRFAIGCIGIIWTELWG